MQKVHDEWNIETETKDMISTTTYLFCLIFNMAQQEIATDPVIA